MRATPGRTEVATPYQPDENGNVKGLILGYYDDSDKLQCRGKEYLGVSEIEGRQ